MIIEFVHCREYCSLLLVVEQRQNTVEQGKEGKEAMEIARRRDVPRDHVVQDLVFVEQRLNIVVLDRGV